MRSSTSLIRALEAFLLDHYHPGGPLLLGCSGGSDSLALLHLLFDLQKKYSLQLIVVHIDHGWRSESAQQALELRQKVEGLGLTFILHTLSFNGVLGNLEERAREARISVFQSLYALHNCQALILAHQADDQAETVIKRIFEGGHWMTMPGMQKRMTFRGMEVWRPLLEVSKQQILGYLSDKNEFFVDDPTNSDPAYLRARMRTRLIPYLEGIFGKNIRDNLCRLAESARKIRQYCEDRAPRWNQYVIRGPFGVMLDLEGQDELHPLEIEVMVRTFLDEEGVSLGTRHLGSIVALLVCGAAHRQLCIHDRVLWVDRKKLFLLRCLPDADRGSKGDEKKMPMHSAFQGGLKEGTLLFSGRPSVRVAVTRAQGVKDPDENSQSLTVRTTMADRGWRDLWRGRAKAVVPVGLYEWQMPEARLSCSFSSSLGKWWGKHQVPAFFRSFFPVLIQNGICAQEFLTGRMNFNQDIKIENQNQFEILIEID